MAIDEDINSSADFNSYSSEQLAELQKSALGESSRELAASSDLMIFTFIFLFIVIAIVAAIFMLTKD